MKAEAGFSLSFRALANDFSVPAHSKNGPDAGEKTGDD